VLINCRFESSFAQEIAGAIASYFTNSHAAAAGGAITLSDGNLIVFKTVFESNAVGESEAVFFTSPLFGMIARGGAIDAELVMERTIFTVKTVDINLMMIDL
jgi:hypothetical protein